MGAGRQRCHFSAMLCSLLRDWWFIDASEISFWECSTTGLHRLAAHTPAWLLNHAAMLKWAARV